MCPLNCACVRCCHPGALRCLAEAAWVRGQPWAALCSGFSLGGQVPQESPRTAWLSAHDYKVLSSRKSQCCLVSLNENKPKPSIFLPVLFLHSSERCPERRLLLPCAHAQPFPSPRRAVPLCAHPPLGRSWVSWARCSPFTV